MTNVISTTVASQSITTTTPTLVTQSGVVDGGVSFSSGSDPGTLIVAGTVTSDGTGVVQMSGDDSTTVAAGGLIYGGGTPTEGIRMTGTNNSAFIHGTVSGRDGGFFITGSDHSIFISQTGVVEGGSNGDGLDAGAFSAAIGGTGQFDVTNAGTIIGQYNPDNGRTIAILQAAVSDASADGFDLSLEVATTVTNSGTIIGDVLLGGGDDVYDSTGGGIVDGDVLLGTGDDTLIGGSAEDEASGGGGADTMSGRRGDDILDGGAGADLLRGGADADELSGGGGADRLRGGADADLLYGDAGQDDVRGGHGDDRLFGGGGNDDLRGGIGNDTMTGGNGFDTFIFKGNFGSDIITDFANSNNEDIDLSDVNSITSWNDLRTNHMSQVNGGVLIDAGNGNEILIEGFIVADLQSGDFIF